MAETSPPTFPSRFRRPRRSWARRGSTAVELIEAIDRRFAERPPQALACVRLGWVDAAALNDLHAKCKAWTSGAQAGRMPPMNAVWNAIAADLWLEHAFGL